MSDTDSRPDAPPGTTANPLRVALLSAWHVHAVDYLREARALQGVEVTAFWDDDAERGRAFAAEHGLPFEGDLDAVLAGDVDAVIVTTPTRDHRAVIGRAAAAGRHVFSEKVLAATIADTETIFADIDAAGVELMLSLPRLVRGPYRAAQRALDEGALGRVAFARCRIAHDGAVDRGSGGWLPARFFDRGAAQGGAMIDLGAHPVYLLNRLVGAPAAVQASYRAASEPAANGGVDDNSVIVCEYEGGALGLVETGFVHAGGPFLLELHGSDGTLLIEDERARLRPAGGGWRELELPPALPSPMTQWRDRVAGGAEPGIGRRDVLDLTRVNEAAAAAARSGARTAL